MSLLHHILQPRWNVYYFNNNLKSTEEKHQISAIHKLNGRPKKFHHSLTHSVLLGYPPVPATWPYFEQWASLPATCAVSPPTPPFLCASSCPGICFSCASSVDSSLGYASVWSPQCEQSIPKLFVLCPSLPVAALLVSRATPCIFVYLTKSAGCFSGSYYMSTWCLCLNPLVSRQVSEPYGSTTFTFHPENFILILIVSALDRHIGLNIANACLAFSIRNWMSSSLPPFLLTMIPSNIWIRPSPRPAPLQWTRQYCVCYRYTLILRPAFAPCSLRLVPYLSRSALCAKVGLDRGLLNISF